MMLRSSIASESSTPPVLHAAHPIHVALALCLLTSELAQPISEGDHEILCQAIGTCIRDAVARNAPADIRRLLEDIIGAETQESVLLFEYRLFE